MDLISSLVHSLCPVGMARYSSTTFKVSFWELFKYLYSSKENFCNNMGNLCCSKGHPRNSKDDIAARTIATTTGETLTIVAANHSATDAV